MSKAERDLFFQQGIDEVLEGQNQLVASLDKDVQAMVSENLGAWLAERTQKKLGELSLAIPLSESLISPQTNTEIPAAAEAQRDYQLPQAS